jgi:8-oxo-dGTP diphosphatase
MNRKYPEVPVCAVGAIIFRQDSVLLVKRGKDPACGQWSIPGGVVRLGETLESAVIREVREETQLTALPVHVGKVIDRIYKDGHGRIQYHYVIVDYLCEVLEGQPVPNSDAAAAGYFKIADLDKLDLTEGTAQVIREVYRDRSPS